MYRPHNTIQFHQWLTGFAAELGADEVVVYDALIQQTATVLKKAAHRVTQTEVIVQFFDQKSINYPPCVALTPYEPKYAELFKRK